MSDSNTYYHFLSASRQGLAAAITAEAEKKRVEVEMHLHVSRREQATRKWDTRPTEVKQKIQLHGPGDVIGFDENMVVRTDPKADSGNFEPNYFPIIEFADVDFPWRYSAKKGDEKGLTPWLTLIVLSADENEPEFDSLFRGTNQVPKIRVHHQTYLPDLNKAWRWAHVQVSHEKQDITYEELVSAIKQFPHRAVSRLMCTRRLQPKTKYHAFIVPTFKLGWAAGIGTQAVLDQTAQTKAMKPGWDHHSDDSIELPYYYSWEFITSVRGDFEHLVRQLKPQKLKGLGLREMDCEDPGFGLSVNRQLPLEEKHKNHILELEGALRSEDIEYTHWGKDDKQPEQVESKDIPGKAADIMLDVLGKYVVRFKSDSFEQRLADELLNHANTDITAIADKPVRVLDPEFNKERVLSDIDFDLLQDGKSVTLLWKTDQTTTGRVQYGIDTGDEIKYDKIANADQPSTTHSVTISLLPETTYNFEIIKIESGVQAGTGNGTLRVPLPTVVPPIYGRWQAARNEVVPADDYWLEELNLDPRHRAGAGLGAEVIRKQQEALMASAWDQAGSIEAVNDILRRAQFGRESANFLHDRFASMDTDSFLSITTPVHKRIMREQEDGTYKTLRYELDKETIIPQAVMSSAFRRINRKRGAIRKRQQGKPTGLISRLASGDLGAAGPHPVPIGTPTPCQVTHENAAFNLAPYVSLNAVVAHSIQGTTCTLVITLNWDSGNAIRLIASGDVDDEDWNGDKPSSGNTVPGIIKTWPLAYTPVDLNDEVVPPTGGVNTGGAGTGYSPGQGGDGQERTMHEYTFILTAFGEINSSKAKVTIIVTDPLHTGEPVEIEVIQDTTPSISGAKDNFCEQNIDCDGINRHIENALQEITSEDERVELSATLCQGLNAFTPPDENEKNTPPSWDATDLGTLRQDIFTALNPNKTILERTKKRLRLNDKLAERFDEDKPNDPLDECLMYPEFPQPMYEPLRDLSESHILPGVEKVRNNTIGVLKTNRRFLEAYMAGLNHEMSSEMLWRKFPTDQRGTYFRQFWDVSEYVGEHDDDPEKSELTVDGKLKDSVREKLKDIPHMQTWQEQRLGCNSRANKDVENICPGPQGQDKEFLVLIIRGDLLKRYPNAVIYAVNARVKIVGGKKTYYPDLPEFSEPINDEVPENLPVSTRFAIEAKKLSYFKRLIRTNKFRTNFFRTRPLTTALNNHTPAEPQYPMFRGSLGADLVFLGFPFYGYQARSSNTNPGKFFVLEERISEARFGLDVAPVNETTGDETDDWSNLNWGDFELSGGRVLAENIGHFLDECDNEVTVWNENDSAGLRAKMTLQKPARLILHADQMLLKDDEV